MIFGAGFALFSILGLILSGTDRCGRTLFPAFTFSFPFFRLAGRRSHWFGFSFCRKFDAADYLGAAEALGCSPDHLPFAGILFLRPFFRSFRSEEPTSDRQSLMRT